MALVLPFVFTLLSYFVFLPILRYYRDVKRLRKFPNLFPASGITNLPMIIEAHKGFPSKARLEAHKIHPILRIGPNSLSFCDAQAIKDIYGHNTKCIKDTHYDMTAGSHHSIFDETDKSEHSRKRKMMASGYAIKNLEEWEFKVALVAGQLVEAFDARCTSAPIPNQAIRKEDLTIDYRLWTNLYTFGAITSIGLSEDMGLIDKGNDLVDGESMDGKIEEGIPFRRCLFAGQWVSANFVWSYRWYRVLMAGSKYVSSTYRRKLKLRAAWDNVVYRRATKRLKRYQNGEQLDDLFSALMNDRNGDAHNLEWGEIVAEVSVMVNAGSDTTAIAISNTMYLLLKNPECMAKLRDEVDKTLDADEAVAPYDKVKYLPYLNACIYESLRMWPPVSMGLPRRTPPEGATIIGEFIPGNTTVSMSAYVVHHNPRIFSDPETYRPERWLGEAGKDLQSFFIAFSAGARGCIGRNISFLEQIVILATLVHRFEFGLPSQDWEPKRWEASTQGMQEMPLKIWRRTMSADCKKRE